MSFVKNPIAMRETPRNARPFKLCDWCETRRAPEGGMDMGNGRWMCAVCWTHRVTRPKGKK